jgi:hypothetical protein
MRRGRRVSAAVVLAAAFFVVSQCVSVGPSWADDDDAQAIFFSGVDVWRNGRFLNGGVLWSADGLDSEGFTLKAVTSAGLYRYRSGALGGATVIGSQATTQLLPGWRFKSDQLEVAIFAGLDVQEGATFPDDPSNRLRGRSTGARVSADLWFEPTEETMIAADASLSSIIRSYSARIAYGWRVLDWFYLGPEAQTFASQGYQQFRLGVHLTAFKTDWFELSAAVGWSRDTDHRQSPYLRLGVLTRE